MIKLIATDMDGTLLDSNKTLPHNFNELVDQLTELNIQLVIASGRQYLKLKEVMGEKQDQFIYISDNGTLVYHHDEVVLEAFLDRSIALKVIETAQKEMNVMFIVSSSKGAYMLEEQYEKLKQEAPHFYSTIKIVSCFEECPDFCKIALFNQTGDHGDSQCIQDLSADISVVTSGLMWVDVYPVNASKGQALEMVCKKYEIPMESVVAFGDEMNDYDVLEKAGISIAMGNAREEIKRISKYITKTNDEEGVSSVLKRIIQNKGQWNEKNTNLF